MTSRSKLVSFGILAVAALAMVGCQGGESTPPADPAAATTAEQQKAPGQAGGASNVADAMAAPEGVKTGLPGPGSRSGG